MVELSDLWYIIEAMCASKNSSPNHLGTIRLGALAPKLRLPDGLQGAAPASKKKIHRATVHFSESAYGALESLAEKQSTSISQVLTNAIALEKFFQDAHDEGKRIFVEKDGRRSQVLSC